MIRIAGGERPGVFSDFGFHISTGRVLAHRHFQDQPLAESISRSHLKKARNIGLFAYLLVKIRAFFEYCRYAIEVELKKLK
jgi:hypothetical protein